MLKQLKFFFNNGEIIIVDDGCGMDEDDINQKFLTVGYPKENLEMLLVQNLSADIWVEKALENFQCFLLQKKLRLYLEKMAFLMLSE